MRAVRFVSCESMAFFIVTRVGLRYSTEPMKLKSRVRLDGCEERNTPSPRQKKPPRRQSFI
jgi:hypothetical protein